jgi:hypothetical protein
VDDDDAAALDALASFRALQQAAPAASILNAHADTAPPRRTRAIKKRAAPDAHQLPLAWPPPADALKQAHDLLAYYGTLVAAHGSLEGPPALQLQMASKNAEGLLEELATIDATKQTAARQRLLEALQKRVRETLAPPPAAAHESDADESARRGAAFSRSCGAPIATASDRSSFGAASKAANAAALPPLASPTTSHASQSAMPPPPVPAHAACAPACSAAGRSPPRKRGRQQSSIGEVDMPVASSAKQARIAGGSKRNKASSGDGRCKARAAAARRASRAATSELSAKRALVAVLLGWNPEGWSPESFYHTDGIPLDEAGEPAQAAGSFVEALRSSSSLIPSYGGHAEGCQQGVIISVPVDTCTMLLSAIAACTPQCAARHATRRATAEARATSGHSTLRALCYVASAALAARRRHTRLFLGSLTHATQLAFRESALQSALPRSCCMKVSSVACDHCWLACTSSRS